MQFAFPIAQTPLWAAVAAGALAGAFLLLRLLERRHEGRLHVFVEASLVGRLMPAYTLRARRPLFWLTLAGVLFLLLAAAQPHWGKKWTPITKTSRDILVLLDVSCSMTAQNPPPTRLDRARQKIESLLEKCPADRFGLIVFSGEAACMCPLTLDQGYFRSILDAVNADTLSMEGSDLASALLEAHDAFEADAQRFGGSENNNRIVLVLSDGEETASDAVETAKKIGALGSIYTLGIGDPQGVVIEFPEWMRQYVRMPDEKLTHISKLDEETLTKIAIAGNGAYVRITPDNADINFIHGEFENVHGKTASDTMRFRLVNRYRWPLVAAWVCFAAEGLWLGLLPWIRRRRLKRMEVPAHA
ncbi:MAG: von Willebrand factor type A domain protein [Candidatus Hydrogenedentes bacterium ADurb.Bin101]|nr:MAG: von Willebrand factor type A domain protein [Candidatus Hydrogenedentes bacterium ADurb.Bin101]